MATFERINEFFDTYAKAMEAYDTKLISLHYSLPCTFITEEATKAFTEATKLEGMFNQGIVFYKQNGIINAIPDVRTKMPWTDKIMLVKMNWRYTDANNQYLYDCDYNYVMKLHKNNQWKIEVSTAINEKERMEAWLKKQKGNEKTDKKK